MTRPPIRSSVDNPFPPSATDLATANATISALRHALREATNERDYLRTVVSGAPTRMRPSVDLFLAPADAVNDEDE